MPYQMTMTEDAILKITIPAVLEHGEVEPLIADITRYVASATPDAPLRILVLIKQHGIKFSPVARKTLATLNADRRLGLVAIVGAERYVRVLIGFILKATGRNNIHFFASEELAMAWLQP